MGKIPKKIKDQLLADPRRKFCALTGYHECSGRITFEHAIIYGGRQLQRAWAIVSVCAKGHEVDNWQDAHTMDKNMNIWVALNQATDAELAEVSKAVDYKRRREYLNEIYGEYRPKYSITNNSLINY